MSFNQLPTPYNIKLKFPHSAHIFPHLSLLSSDESVSFHVYVFAQGIH